MGGQLVLRGTPDPRTSCPRGTCGPRTSCPGGTAGPRTTCPADNFRRGTSCPATPSPFRVRLDVYKLTADAG